MLQPHMEGKTSPSLCELIVYKQYIRCVKCNKIYINDVEQPMKPMIKQSCDFKYASHVGYRMLD